MGELEEMKERAAQVWGLGDYSVLARMFEPAAVALCDACAVSAGQEVLDAAAGDGSFALACAREGASVVASDLAPAMVELGGARSAAEGYEIEWVVADIEDLPFEDARFDCAGSSFGAFLTPRPEVTAAELFRVVRPGGTVGLTAWAADGFFGELMEVSQRFNPTPEGFARPIEWGDETLARGRLEPLASYVESERGSVALTGDSVEGLIEVFADSSPPYAAARAALPADQYQELVGEATELARRWNRAGDGAARVDTDYLIFVARKRG